MLRYIVVIAFAFVFSSCTNKSENNLAIYRSIQVSLVQSSNAIAESNKQICLAIEGRAQNPRTGAYAKQWQPKTLLIKDLSDNTTNYIDSLIMALKNEAGLKMQNDRETFREDDKDAVERVFINDNKGKELQTRLMQYKAGMLAVDTELLKQFEHITINVSDTFFKKDFTKTYFQDIPTIAALAVLKKYKNEIVNTENQFLSFCLNKSAYSICGFGERVQAIVSQSSSYIKAGDKIEITAGIGSFYIAAYPKITIKDKVFPYNTFDGIAKYKFKTPLKSGKYYVPVKIEFITENGERRTVKEKVEYTVVE